MIHPALAVYATIGLVAGPVWFLHGFQSFRRKRLIENTPTARIRSMAMGLVEVNGRVSGRSEIAAPFSGRPCAFWQVDISTPTGKQRWRVVHQDQSGHPFFLTDDTGTAMIYPQGAECRVNFQVEEECLGISLPDCYAEYLKEHTGATSMLWRLGRLRFRERLLEDGQIVYVLGTAMPRSQAVRISDDEMLATGTDGPSAFRHPQLDPSATATIRKGPNEPTFLISQSSERELTFMLAFKAFGGMVGGPIATLFALGWWLVSLASLRGGHSF